MLNLSNSLRFKEDYNNLSNRIDKITNEKLQSELRKLLVQLVNEVRNIDKNHERLLYDKKLPDSTVDSKSKLLEIRRKIDKRLSDWNRIQKN